MFIFAIGAGVLAIGLLQHSLQALDYRVGSLEIQVRELSRRARHESESRL